MSDRILRAATQRDHRMWLSSGATVLSLEDATGLSLTISFIWMALHIDRNHSQYTGKSSAEFFRSLAHAGAA